MDLFPFPDRKTAQNELKKDLLYHKIPVSDREKICNMAWNRGEKTAFRFIESYPDKEIYEIIRMEGAELIILKKDEVNGRVRTFGEYYSEGNRIILYGESIRKWAQANGISGKLAENMVAAHEFYHFLECTRIGETAKLYMVPVVKLGKFVFQKAGIRRLSEISADGFARTFYEWCKKLEEEKGNWT